MATLSKKPDCGERPCTGRLKMFEGSRRGSGPMIESIMRPKAKTPEK